MQSLRRSLLIVLALAVSSCDQHSVSGTYIATQTSSAEFLELTQTQDGKVAGSLRHIELKRTGEVDVSTANLSGVVDGEKLTLMVTLPGTSGDLNLGGTVTKAGLDLNLSGVAGRISDIHFSHGTVSAFNAEADRLTRAGESIRVERLRGEKVEALNRVAAALEVALDDYVTRANKQIKETPRFLSYFSNAAKQVGERIRLAQRLAVGNDGQRAQAEVLFAQVEGSEPTIRNTSDSIDDAIEQMARDKVMLNTRLSAFGGNCLGKATSVKPGDVIPDMGPCKGLIAAVARFDDVATPLHESHIRLRKLKVEAMGSLESSWRLALGAR